MGKLDPPAEDRAIARPGRNKHIPSRSRKIGLPPGSLVYVGREKAPVKARITVIVYAEDRFEEFEVSQVSELLPLAPSPAITWINVDTVHDETLLQEFGEAFQLNPLFLEDILNTDQRPKCEYQEHGIYVILKMFDFETEADADQSGQVLAEQVSMVIGGNYLLTFQEEVGDEFDGVRARLRGNQQRLRRGGAGYLAYSLIDTVVDRYFLVLEKMGESLADLEECLIASQPPNILHQVHQLKREMIYLRKHIWPVREVVSSLEHADTGLLSRQTQLHLRDVYDHTVQAMDTLETYRDLLGGIQDLYLSVLSNRMNEVMKVLTIISTIFIPLTFIVGVYGMNFEHMPELKLTWGYPTVWAFMFCIAIGMMFFFKHKRWLD